MNTDKTLNEKFAENKEYPIWYYKELKEVDISYIIWNLLKETFVVEIDGIKYEITFGKNRKGEFAQCITYNDIKNSSLVSCEVIDRGFEEGKWFTISDTDTSNEFKSEFLKEKMEYEREEIVKYYKEILKNAISSIEGLSMDKRNSLFIEIDSSSYEHLENLVSLLIKKLN